MLKSTAFPIYLTPIENRSLEFISTIVSANFLEKKRSFKYEVEIIINLNRIRI